MIAIIGQSIAAGHGHVSDFSLKVPAKPVMKTGAGAGDRCGSMPALPVQGQG